MDSPQHSAPVRGTTEHHGRQILVVVNNMCTIWNHNVDRTNAHMMRLPQCNRHNLVFVRSFPIILRNVPCLQSENSKGVSDNQALQKFTKKQRGTTFCLHLKETCIVCCCQKLVFIIASQIHNCGPLIMIPWPKDGMAPTDASCDAETRARTHKRITHVAHKPMWQVSHDQEHVICACSSSNWAHVHMKKVDIPHSWQTLIRNVITRH